MCGVVWWFVCGVCVRVSGVMWCGGFCGVCVSGVVVCVVWCVYVWCVYVWCGLVVCVCVCSVLCNV